MKVDIRWQWPDSGEGGQNLALYSWIQVVMARFRHTEKYKKYFTPNQTKYEK